MDKYSMTIIKKAENWYVLQFRDNEGFSHWVDPFKTYNEAYEWFRRYYSEQDDLK